MRKHHRIILNYYLKYMSGFDAQMLRNVVMVSLSVLSWDMSMLDVVPCRPFKCALRRNPYWWHRLLTLWLTFKEERAKRVASLISKWVIKVDGNCVIIFKLVILNIFVGSPTWLVQTAGLDISEQSSTEPPRQGELEPCPSHECCCSPLKVGGQFWRASYWTSWFVILLVS